MEFLLNFNSWFKNLPASGKLSLFFVLIAMLSAGVLLKSHYETAGYQYLYTNLSLSDANGISEKLQSMGVKAKIQGDAVLVPGDRVLELRNNLAAEGYPKGGGVGFEIFDKQDFGATEFQQRVNYIRAVQGELARTIGALDGVETARVHLVVPEKSLFSEDQKQPTSSIAITLAKGRRLTPAQVSGVVHMVMTSVEGLTEANINVVDQNGNILFKASGGDGIISSSKNIEIQASTESKVEKRVMDMLESIVGVGRASVKVSLNMDFLQRERTVESIDPESRVALSENVTTETSSGSSGGASGAPGAEAAAGGSAGGRSENSKRTETTSTYTVSKTTERIVDPVGTIKKLAVAVVVDGAYDVAEDGKRTYKPRTEDEMKKITELVRNAVGFDEARGDELKVENIQFNVETGQDVAQQEFITATNSSRWTQFLLDNAKLLGVALILGVILFLIVRLVNSYAPPIEVAYANLVGQEAVKIAEALPAKATVNIIKRDAPEAKAAEANMASQMPEAALMSGGGGGITFVESEKSITVEAVKTSEEKLRLQAAKMQAEALVRSNVDEATQVIRAWLNE